MDEMSTNRITSFSNPTHCRAIDQHCCLRVTFTGINCGKGGTVNDSVWTLTGKNIMDRLTTGDVNCVNVNAESIVTTSSNNPH